MNDYVNVKIQCRFLTISAMMEMRTFVPMILCFCHIFKSSFGPTNHQRSFRFGCKLKVQTLIIALGKSGSTLVRSWYNLFKLASVFDWFCQRLSGNAGFTRFGRLQLKII